MTVLSLLAVVGVLIEEGAENPSIAPLWAQLAEAPARNEEVHNHKRLCTACSHEAVFMSSDDHNRNGIAGRDSNGYNPLMWLIFLT